MQSIVIEFKNGKKITGIGVIPFIPVLILWLALVCMYLVAIAMLMVGLCVAAGLCAIGESIKRLFRLNKKRRGLAVP